MNEAMRTLPNQVHTMNEAMRTLPNQVLAMTEAMRTLPNQVLAMNEVIQSLSATRITDYLSTLDIDEITEAFEEYSNLNIDSQNAEEVVKTEELTAYIENEINQSQDNKLSLKDFLQKIALTFGITVAISFIITVVIPYFLAYSNNLFDNHQAVVDTLQETLNSLVSMLGDNLIATATIKDTLKEKKLSDYEHLSLIGMLRTNTYLRKGSSKSAPLATRQKLKVNTVVNLLEINQKLTTKRKQNWLKVSVKISDNYVEGWIEESKIQRFKKI